MGKYCPICGAKLSLNGRRMLKCKGCGLIVDRDVIGAWNIRLRGLKDRCGEPRSRRKPLNETREGKTLANNYYQMFRKLARVGTVYAIYADIDMCVEQVNIGLDLKG